MSRFSMKLVEPADISGRSDSKSRSTATRRTCLRLAASASSGRRFPETVAPPITPKVCIMNRRRVTAVGIAHPLPYLPQTHLGEHRDGIRVIHIALDIFSHHDVVELGKEGDETDIA